MQSDNPSMSAKQLIYTILLNTDTQVILDDYVVDYIKSRPNLLNACYEQLTVEELQEVKNSIDLKIKQSRQKIVNDAEMEITRVGKCIYLEGLPTHYFDKDIMSEIIYQFDIYGRVKDRDIGADELYIKYKYEWQAEQVFNDRFDIIDEIREILLR